LSNDTANLSKLNQNTKENRFFFFPSPTICNLLMPIGSSSILQKNKKNISFATKKHE